MVKVGIFYGTFDDITCKVSQLKFYNLNANYFWNFSPYIGTYSKIAPKELAGW